MRRADLCEGHKPTHLTYRITCAEYGQLLARFGGRCDRCGQVTTAPVIDHDHAIGQAGVRGMICHRCNLIVGVIEEGRRPDDGLTRTYLGSPFHVHLAEVQPGYRAEPDGEIPALVDEIGVARILRTSRHKVRQLVTAGQLPGVWVDGTWVFRRSVVEAARAKPDPE